jgi:hypothetical protein
MAMLFDGPYGMSCFFSVFVTGIILGIMIGGRLVGIGFGVRV